VPPGKEKDAQCPPDILPSPNPLFELKAQR
jgi:hypothetical protein